MHLNQRDPNPELLIKFVSLPPGAGKTMAAIELMKRHLCGKLEMKRVPKYVFYVAATKLLLKQTSRNLHIALGKKDLSGQIRMVYGDRTDPVTVHEQVKNVLNGRSNFGAHAQPFEEGAILFITHEAFLMLDPQHLHIFADTLVIFDEARKWATMPKPLTMDDRAEEFFGKLFDKQPMRDGNGALVTNISELTAKPFPDNQKVAALQGCGKKAVRAFKELDALHRMLNVPIGTPTRIRAYTIDDERRRKKATGERVMIQVRLPSFPFHGFSDVLILSADFMTSQMYCFLKDEGTRVVNKSRWFMDTFHPAGYTKAVNSVVKRYDYIDIVALNTDPTPPAIGRYRSGGLMVPRSRLLELGNVLSEWGMNSKAIMDCIERVRNPVKLRPSADDAAKVKFLVEKLDAKTNMLRWMVNRAHKVVRDWRKTYPCKEKALLFLNQDFREGAKIDDKLFRPLNHAKTVGDNRWSGSNVVVFLAAINPQPYMMRLLRARLGYLNYDPHEDFIVDKVIQAAGRGNIRTHGIKDRMLIVVPTENLALRVAERMNEAPEILSDVTEELGNYTSWSHNTYNSVRSRAEKPREAKRVKRKLSPEERLKEHALYQAAYRARKNGDMETYSELEAQRDALRFEK